MPDIVITPNRGTTSNPKIDFTGTSAGTIKLEVLSDGTIAWNGANGSLFSIADSLSGSLMSVNDISGLPAFEVFSDNRVVVGQFGANLLLGKTTSSSNGRLQLTSHTTNTGGIGFGSDVTLFRSAADILRTEDSFYANGEIYAVATGGGLKFSASSTTGLIVALQGGGIQFRNSSNANLLTLADAGNVIINSGTLVAGNVGTAIGAAPIVVNGTVGDNDSHLIIKKPSQSSLSFLAWDGGTYIATNTYYENGTWIHNAPAGNTNSQLLNFIPGTGVKWWTSNNSTSSWNVSSDLLLWNDSGVWQRSLSNTLTLATSGTGLSGSATYNNSGAVTFTVTSNATSANTASTIVARDGSGNFSAGTITASNVSTTTLTQGGTSGHITKEYTFNLSAQSNTQFFPIRLTGTPIGAGGIHTIEVLMDSFTGGDPYNHHSVHGQVRGSGWTDLPAFYDVFHNCYQDAERSYLGFFKGTQNCTDVILYVRGGKTYYVKTPSTASVSTTALTISDSVFAIKDSNAADVSGTSANISFMLNLITASQGRQISSNIVVSGSISGSSFAAGGNTVWHAGNDGSGSGLDADLLDGYNQDTANTASAIVRRDGSGFINATAIQTSSGGSNGVRVHSNSGITASNNYMNFFTSQTNGWAFNTNGTGADANTVVVIDAGGDLGIGTTNPTYKFEISGAASTSGVARIGSIDYTTSTVLSVAPGVVNFDAPGVVGGRLKINSAGNVGINNDSPSYKLDVNGDIYTNAALKVGKVETASFSLGFTNNTANRAVDIRFPNTYINGLIEIEVTSGYSYQNSVGVVKKIFSVGTNPTNGIWNTTVTRVVEAHGVAADNWTIGDFAWDATNSKYIIPVYHIVSSGNVVNINIRYFSEGAISSPVLPTTTLSAEYTATIPAAYQTRHYVYYNDRLGIGTSAPSTLFQVASTSTGNFRLDTNGSGGHYYQGESNARLGLGRDLITSAGHITFTMGGGSPATVGSAITMPANSQLGFYTSNGSSLIERVRIDGSGNVGIGTTSPTSLFTIQGSQSEIHVKHDATRAITIGNWDGTAQYIKSINLGVALTPFVLQASRFTFDTGNVGIGITSPTTKLDVNGNANINGIVGASNGKLSLGILDINSGGTPSYIKINTTIPAGSTSSDFTVTIKGFYYNGARSMEIRVSWHYYLAQFWNACATSSGGWAPEIKLSEEGGFVKITLTSPGYWPKLFVESVYSSAYGSSYSSGWSWTDAAATNSPVTVTYVSDFGNSNYAFTSGLYATNFVDTNNSNYWCDPNGTSILRNIQIGPASGGGPGLISIWEAESVNNTGGAINSDASASSGQNWGTNTNTQLYGPYVNLPRGNYRFTARIKVADASYTGNSVRMQVLPIASKVVSQDRYIRGVDFSGNDVWETFSIPFKVIASTSSDVEFYVFGLNSKQIYVDYIAIFLDTDSHTQQVWGNLYANGNVGIGTTTPNYKLELSGTVGLSGFSGGSYRKLATPSYWGYSNSYKSIILGSSSTTYSANDGAVTLCFGVDISGNASGSFTGDGRELVFRNLTRFVTPNSSNDNYLNPLTFNNGNVGVAIDSPSFKFQVAGAGSIGDGAFIVSGNTASSSFYDQNVGAYFHTPGAMIRKDSSRTTPQTSEATLVLYNKNGTDATNTKLVFASNETTSTSANPVATAAIVSEKVSGTAGGWAVGNLQFLVKNGANYTNSVVVDNTGVTVAGALTVQDGTESTNTFGLKTFTKSLTVTTSWSDVGISGSDLATGTYIIQVTVDNYDVSGGQYQERYSGVMSWIAGVTNSTDVDEIVLHKAGHAPNGNWINLRTVRQAPNLTMKLQIIASGNTSAADNYVFKFRRMI